METFNVPTLPSETQNEQPVNSQLATIICSSTPTFITNNNPVTTYTVQVVTPAELKQIGQDQLGQVIKNSSAQGSLNNYPVFITSE